MIRHVVRRSLRAVAALVGVIAVVFVLVHLSGDPSYILLPLEASPEQRAAFRHQYGLDRPLVVQFVTYLAHVAQGDFGQSFSFQIPALHVVLQRLPATLELTVAALVISTLIAIPAAMLAAVKRGTRYDRALMGVVLIVTVIGLQFGGLLGGAVMTETVFAWPGVGTMILDAILKKDYPVVLAG